MRMGYINIWVRDKVGNQNYQAYSIEKIDTVSPELEIENILTTWGLKDRIKLRATDDLIGLSGYSISKEEKNI